MRDDAARVRRAAVRRCSAEQRDSGAIRRLATHVARYIPQRVVRPEESRVECTIRLAAGCTSTEVLARGRLVSPSLFGRAAGLGELDHAGLEVVEGTFDEDGAFFVVREEVVPERVLQRHSNQYQQYMR